MRFAYADPPYLGCAKAHYSSDPSGIVAAEVDHLDLIKQLETFDSWALSTHSPGLRVLLPMCPPDARVGAWVKPFCSFKPNVNPAFAWEPVIFRGARKRGRNDLTVPDFVIANITMRTGTHGAKPQEFCFWLFELMGLKPDDELFDLYPGSGAVTSSWETWKRLASLFPDMDAASSLELETGEQMDMIMKGGDGK